MNEKSSEQIRNILLAELSVYTIDDLRLFFSDARQQELETFTALELQNEYDFIVLPLLGKP